MRVSLDLGYAETSNFTNFFTLFTTETNKTIKCSSTETKMLLYDSSEALFRLKKAKIKFKTRVNKPNY